MVLRRALPCVLALLLAGCASSGKPPVQHPRRVPADFTGTFTTWWSDERVREEGSYKAGRRDGHVKGFHPDGSLAFEGDFRDGAPVGQLVQNAPGGARAMVQDVAQAAPLAAPPSPQGALPGAVPSVPQDTPQPEPQPEPQPAPQPAPQPPAPEPPAPQPEPEPDPPPPETPGVSPDATAGAPPAVTPAATQPATAAAAPVTSPSPAKVAAASAPPAAARAQGERLESWPGGGPKSRTNLVNGELDGVAEQWHQNGQPASRGQYIHGVPTGEWQAWDEQGHPTTRTVYWTAGGRPAGYLETVQEADGRISVQTRMLLEGSDLVGRVTTWYPNGGQAGLVEYRNGVREGRDVSWDVEGHKRSEGRRAADLREGVWTTWDESGAVESRTLFEHDRALGPAPAGT